VNMPPRTRNQARALSPQPPVGQASRLSSPPATRPLAHSPTCPLAHSPTRPLDHSTTGS